MFSSLFRRNKNKKLKAAQKNDDVVGIFAAILDEFHDEAQHRMKMAYELKQFGEDQLDAVNDVVRILDKYTENKSIDLDKHFSNIIKEMDASYDAVCVSENTLHNGIKQSLFKKILDNINRFRTSA